MNNIRFLLTSLIFVILITTNCTDSAYTGFYFAYPINVKPHDESAQYIGKVIIHKKLLSTNSKHELRITIQDRQKNVLLDDKMILSEGNVFGKAEWKEFENITLHIYRVNRPSEIDELAPFRHDSIPSKFNEIVTLIYKYDNNKKLFKYVETKSKPEL